MKESIKRIIISLSFIIAVFLFTIVYINIKINKQNAKGIEINNRTININILENKILCEDIMLVNMNSKEKFKYKFFESYKDMKNVNLYLNNNRLYNSPDLLRGNINLDKDILNASKIGNKEINVKITYELNMDYITRYKNTDVISLYIESYVYYIKNLKINLNSNYTINNLSVDGAKIRKSTNGYTINMNNISYSKDIDIAFNINKELSNKKDKEFISQMVKEYSFINDRKYILVILIIISVVLLIISLSINNKKKITNYRRDTSDLISPILSEAVIDKKIGIKELIMTTIIELNIRGNIKILDNKTIELISYDNLEKYEKEIVDLLFKKNIIKFSDINNIFSSSNKSTNEFSNKINLIKESLLKKLYSMNVFSKRLTIFNKCIGLCSLLISINMPRFFLSGVLEPVYNIFFIISLFVTLFYIKSIISKKTIREEFETYNKDLKKNRIIAMGTLLMVGFITYYSINVAKYHTIFFIFTLLVICLNIYIVYRSQSIILTKEGKEEQRKLLELKKYINDYSLIKNRDLESVIVWDKYLAYATAFGIPNQVINNIYEEWYNLNINLQVVDKLLRL